MTIHKLTRHYAVLLDTHPLTETTAWCDPVTDRPLLRAPFAMCASIRSEHASELLRASRREERDTMTIHKITRHYAVLGHPSTH